MSGISHDNIHWISNRVSVSQTKERFVAVIIPDRNKTKMVLLFFWLFFWTVCGLYIIVFSFSQPDSKWKVPGIVYTFFWLYFEGIAIRVFQWRKWGREVLVIARKKGEYKKQTGWSEKKRIFDISRWEDCRVLEFNPRQWGDYFTASFWHIGKPRLELKAEGTGWIWGYQLTDEEAHQLCKRIKFFLKEYKKQSRDPEKE